MFGRSDDDDDGPGSSYVPSTRAFMFSGCLLMLALVGVILWFASKSIPGLLKIKEFYEMPVEKKR